jgi:demethylmenaquinone methyltransferase/2-methoxy-6-polyprenyl-1,4-benzoquinol methylase
VTPIPTKRGPVPPDRCNEKSDAPAASDVLWDARRLRSPHRQADKAHRVRRMFDRIAPTYELMNRLASLGCDASWRRRAVSLAGASEGDSVLDVACGTGDLARAFAERAGKVVGVDFAANMVALAAARGGAGLHWCLGDALRLPFPDGTFNMTCCGFGVRNFQDLSAGLREMHRTLRPGGRAVILEFVMPAGRLFRWFYGLYLRRAIPLLARVVSRDRTNAYRYLACSVVSFLSRDQMVDHLGQAGFVRVTAFPLTWGIVVVYVAEKAP